MGDTQFVVSYVQACTGGKLPAAECSPMWQLLAIVALLLLAITILVALRLRAGAGLSG